VSVTAQKMPPLHLVPLSFLLLLCPAVFSLRRTAHHHEMHHHQSATCKQMKVLSCFDCRKTINRLMSMKSAIFFCIQPQQTLFLPANRSRFLQKFAIRMSPFIASPLLLRQWLLLMLLLFLLMLLPLRTY
jgi:hypothetical protein